jgi:site-specific DNA recombinase
MRRGRLARYRAGLLLPWVQPVYGYLLDIEHPRDPRGARVSEVQAAVVRQLFAWYLEDGGGNLKRRWRRSKVKSGSWGSRSSGAMS